MKDFPIMTPAIPSRTSGVQYYTGPASESAAAHAAHNTRLAQEVQGSKEPEERQTGCGPQNDSEIP